MSIAFLGSPLVKKTLGVPHKFNDFMGLSSEQYFLFIARRGKTFYKFLVK